MRLSAARTWPLVLCAVALLVAGATGRAVGQSPTAAPTKPAGQSPRSAPTPSAAAAGAAKAANPLLGIKTWGYQLRGMDPAEVARSPYDAVVIDFAQGGREFTADEIKAMRAKPDGTRRLLLAYLSIGEAERYRFYWQTEWYLKPPPFMGPENPEWRGNYPVRYWDLAWQKVMFGEPTSYLDRIMKAGFDGAYLDRVDVYSFWEGQHPQAKRQMMDFVAGLSAYAKYRTPEFLVVPQNAEELLEDDLYLRAIDAVAKEDLLYGVNHTETANARDEVTYSVDLLKRAKKGGKAVLVVEYICRKLDIARAERRLRQEFDFVPYVGPRTLHRLGLAEEDYCLPVGPGGRRVALVVGNGSYDHGPRLPTPGADAKAVAAALRRLGFTEVRERIDLTRDALDHELQRFAETAKDADWALVYFAGLGLAFDGGNYLLPVDVKLDRAEGAATEAVPLERFLEAVARAKMVRLVLLDACRANAFLERNQKRGLTRAAGPGVLAGPGKLPVLVGYASRCAEPVPPAAGPLDAYTAALLQHLETPGIEVPLLLERVKDSVLRQSAGRQEPVYLGPPPAGPSAFKATAADAGAKPKPAAGK